MYKQFRPLLLLGSIVVTAFAFSPRITNAATWTPVIDDNFNRANTATSTAGSTSGAGNNWTDVNGGIWYIKNNTLNADGLDNGGYLTDFLLRPSGENAVDQREIVTLPAGQIIGPSAGPVVGIVLRYQSGSNNQYLMDVNANSTTTPLAIDMYTLEGGSVNVLGRISGIVPYNSSHSYTYDFSATGTSPTTLNVIVTDLNTSTVVATTTMTDNTTDLQQIGGMGISNWSGGVFVSRVQTFNSTSSPAIIPGTLSFESTGPNSISILTTAASGGTPSFDYQWERGTASGGPYTNVTNGTGLNLTDAGLSSGTNYYYVMHITDASSTMATSTEIHIKTQPSTLTNAVIVGIGDSITNGSNNTGGVSPLTRLQSDLSSNVHFASAITYNEAVGGTQTSDWQPGGSNYNTALSQIQNQGANMVALMLGTNDSKTANNVSGSQYTTNMTNIINGLLAAGIQKVFVSYQPYVDYGQQPGQWSAQSLVALQSYRSDIDALDNSSTVRRIGVNPSLYATTQAATSTYLDDGVHLATAGVNLFGDKWATDIDTIVNAPESSSGGRGTLYNNGVSSAAPSVNTAFWQAYLSSIGQGTSTTTTSTTTTVTLPNCPIGVCVVNPSAGTSTPSTSATPSITPPLFTRDLYLGITGADVKALQQYLNTHGFTVSASGAGSPGHETTTFGSKTQTDLSKFQKAHNIKPSLGYFGSISRAFVNSTI